MNRGLPILVAPMFLVTGIELIKACLKKGISIAFPALNQRTSEGFEAWILEIQDHLSREPSSGTWGVNLIVHKSNPRLQKDLELCVKHKAPLVITSLGAVKDVVDAVHSYNGQIFHDVTNLKHAEKAIAAGVDGLILVAAGAGGHAGTASPFGFVKEIRSIFKGKIVLAGSITNGADIAAARLIGADMAYIGTRFIATKESLASEDYKKMIVQSRISDIVYTPWVSGVPANFMMASLTRAGFSEENRDRKVHMDLEGEAKAWRDIWSAGHGVAGISDIPSASELIDRLRTEFDLAKSQLSNY